MLTAGGQLDWNNYELSITRVLTNDVEACNSDRNINLTQGGITLRQKDAETLVDGLSVDWPHLLFVRQLFQQLRFDENRIFRWRFEHKLVQALLVNYYCRGAVPVTRGVWRDLVGKTPAEALSRLLSLDEEAGIIKSALGEASGETGDLNQLEAVCRKLSLGESLLSPNALWEEDYVIQEKLPIEQEYRVHSFQADVIPGLTFYRFSSKNPTRLEIEHATRFVQHVLDSLPPALVGGTLYGWDVALSTRGVWFVIEANPAGFHPVFRRGFQCSGVFQSVFGGPEAISRLLRFVAKRYNLTVRVEPQNSFDDRSKLYRLVAHSIAFSEARNRLHHQLRSANSYSMPIRVCSFDPKLSPEENVLICAQAEMDQLSQVLIQERILNEGRTRRNPPTHVRSRNKDRCTKREADVVDLFERQVEMQPDAIALEGEEESITYRELDIRSSRLARFLRLSGVREESAVAICIGRGPMMVIALLGTLKAGAAYLPLDPSSPARRLEYMLAYAQPSIILTETKFKDRLAGSYVRQICLDEDFFVRSTQSVASITRKTRPGNLAYILFTSGSTGQPKGVAIEHRGLTNVVVHLQRVLGVRPPDRWVAITSISFDIAALEVFLPLISGARLLIAPETMSFDGASLSMYLQRAQPTIMQATPLTWRILLEAGWPGLPRLKALCGGDVLDQTLADELKTNCSQVFNLYGPTETTIWSSMLELSNYDGKVTVGYAISDTDLYVLDEELECVPNGMVGEIYIGGVGVARGYFNDPGLTADRFVASAHTRPGARLYRTGDLGRRGSDGTLECLGRTDLQVKISGNRVALNEIEAVLKQHATVVDAAVAIVENTPGHKSLIGYVLQRSGVGVAQAQLREFLEERVPEYMVPKIVNVTSLPHTPTGKIDRIALSQLHHAFVDDQSFFVEAESETEKTLANIWGSILGRSGLSAETNFIDLGGDSLYAARCIARVRSAFGIDLPFTVLFEESGTVRSIARLIDGMRHSPIV